ncbi:acyltransferase Pun1-like [Lycium ferocissimum]|uniref:acyltransferase Pun1-like n=1 Tax=Lycium ferocissimum TaxID=112874 RepID=UPI002814B977|nr:acyltransferase Pun1-like [Lycium ferocissimum]
MAASRLISVSKKLNKPFSPTPSPLKYFKLSLLDQVLGNMYMPLAFFYPKKPAQISQILETSLSKFLTSYYPFAGRLRDNIFIDCNDKEARLINVHYDCPMSENVNLPDTGPKYLPFAKGMTWNHSADEDSLVVAQLSNFDCGGIAISACISHKLGDASTLCKFMSNWAITTKFIGMKGPSPMLIGSSIFPPSKNVPLTKPMIASQIQLTTTNRYLFSSSKLNALKAMISSQSGVQNPSRVEVASALLHKCAIAASKTTSGSFKSSILNQFANLRSRMVPPLPQSSVGNIISSMSILTTKEEDVTLASVFKELRKEKEIFKKKDPIKENQLLSALGNFDKQQEMPSSA